MSRRKADPFDIAFDHWKALDTDGQQRFADQQRGYLGAMAVQSGTPAVRTRQRKPHVPKVDGKPVSLKEGERLPQYELRHTLEG